MTNNNAISILGSGNVGRRIGEYFAKFNNVIFYDIDESVIKKLNSQGHICTLDINFALTNSSISFVCVPTPIKEDRENEKNGENGENGKNGYDMSYLTDVSKSIGKVLKNKNEYHTIVIKSTVTPGTTENLIDIIENYSFLNEGKDFGVVYNPEFLTVISNTWNDDKKFCIDAANENRIVLGESDSNKHAGDIVKKLYRDMNSDIPILRTDYKTSEFCKLVANNRLALAISFSNEIFLNCEELRSKGIDIDDKFVMDSIAMDTRIGKYGSVYGLGWGGPCFLKDTVVLRNYLMNKTENYPRLISGSIDVNNEMKDKYGIREIRE